MLVGSWDKQGHFDKHWSAPGTPMQASPSGAWQASLELQVQPDQQFWWGVKERGTWLLFTREALCFVPAKTSSVTHRLGHRGLLGLHPQGAEGFRAGLWAPRARSVELLVEQQSWSLEQKGEYWFCHSPSGWPDILGRPYAFRLVTSEGEQVLRVDPYARRRQGPQSNLSDLFVTAKGEQTHRYAQDPKGHHLLRFESPGAAQASAPWLELRRDGHPLGRKTLDKLLQPTAPLPEGESWWADSITSKGQISLVQSEGGYSICLGPAKALKGLEFQIHGGRNDPWRQTVDGLHNWAGLGLVSEPLQTAHPKPEFDPEVIIYEMHPGSLLGQGRNLQTSTLEQVTQKLSQIRKQGFTAIALMPTNPTEGIRDWGYLGTCSLSHHEPLSALGWGEKSLIAFIEQAHQHGLRVFTDVVYNHVGGDHNDWWEFDGLSNPYFEWNTQAKPKPNSGALPSTPQDTAEAKPRTLEPSVKNTPWGPIPAFNREAVTRFFVDHAMDQLQRIGFDGIRFDFTNFIHHPDSGGGAGWRMLQEINARVRHFFPQAMTFAEEFPPNPILTRSTADGGAGFNAMWNTEHQHRLIFHHHSTSVTSALVQDQEPPLGHFLNHLLSPQGFDGPLSSATVLSNHDEVGNAVRLANIVKGHKRGWDIARLVSWISLLAPGYPILFQGTEDLAENNFSWGIPGSWDLDSHLTGAKLAPHRRSHLRSIRDLLNFRKSEPDLHAGVNISDHLLVGRLLGYRRGRFWILGNFGPRKQHLPAELNLKAKPVLNSELSRYGNQGRGQRGRTLGAYACKVYEVE